MVRLFRKVLFSIACAIVACLSPLSAQEYIGGVLPGNTVYSAGLNPYIVIETLVVPEGITLTIEPGTRLFFMVGTKISVEGGTLIANGLPELPILFTAQTDNKWDGLNFLISKTLFDEQGNYLGGNILSHISILQTTTAVVLSDSAGVMADHISIENADYGIYLLSGSTLLLTNSIIDQCSYGMYIKNSSHNTISDCRISNCDIGIFFPSNNQSNYNLISNNQLSHNRNIALFMSIGQSNIQFNRISGNTVAHNDIGLHIGNGGNEDLGYNNIVSNTIQFNNIGIKLSQDADTLRANLIESNVTGIILAKAGHNHILNNIIQNNSQPGILVTDGSNLNSIAGNGIYGNYTGIRVTHKDFKYSVNNRFSYNSFSGNLNEALLFESGPQQPIEFNSISGTRDTAVIVNHYYTDLEAPNNWFGTTDTTLIDSLIYDMHDQNIFGEVIYKPFLTWPDPQSPISKPTMVIKRLTGNRVLVDWRNNPETDLAGYKVYYGQGAESLFSTVIDVGTDTMVLITDLSIGDSVAVTAYDTDANGLADQFEGHESAFSYAIAGPYAGNDTLICQGFGYYTVTATAPDGQDLVWSSSGDGIFSAPDNLITLYTPGQADVLNGSVTLTLSQQTEQLLIADEMVIQISGVPFVFAGNDTIVNQYEPFVNTSAEAGNYTDLLWTTTGDGTFSDPLSLLTSYMPGVSDISLGMVRLILQLNSSCGNLSDTLYLAIIPSYSVNGKVHKQLQPAGDGIVVAINTLPEAPRAISTTYTNSEGLFGFTDLPVGNYYFYAITNPQSNHEWIPTYYAESAFWQSAYPMPLNTDVYDVDINLTPVSNKLPAGNGSISGSFLYQDKTSDDDSIYMVPWFGERETDLDPFLGYPASNHVVLLMNTSLNRVFDWALTASDGSFTYTQLPYGSYRLWGEKAGYTNSLSPVITLSPQNSQVEGVQLNINLKNIEITLPQNATLENNVIIFPNPASDWIWFNDNAIGDFQTLQIRFFDATGRQVMETVIEHYGSSPSGGIDVSGLKPGLYVCILSGQKGFSHACKVTIAR